jgi:hypothetical protein
MTEWTKIKTSELEGNALNWAVAKAQGYRWGQYEDKEESICVQLLTGAIKFIKGGTAMDWISHGVWSPSTDWNQGGPILDKMIDDGFTLVKADFGMGLKMIKVADDVVTVSYGETALLATMRCFVLSNLGQEIDVPSELTPKKVLEKKIEVGM